MFLPLRPSGWLLLTLLVAHHAAAQPSAAEVNEARRHFRAAKALHDLGSYSEAIREFAMGYALVPLPEFLINMAQSYRQLVDVHHARHMDRESLEDMQNALDNYDRYLRVAPADAPERPQVSQLVGSLQKQLAELKEAAEHSRADATARARVEAERARAEAERARAETAALRQSLVKAEPAPRRPSVAPWVVFSIGTAAVVVGAVLGGLALKSHDDALRAPQAQIPQLQDSARTYAISADATLAAGGVVAGAGLIWGAIDVARWRRARARMGLAP